LKLCDCVRYTVLVQKGNTDIIKVVHVTSEGYLECFEASKIDFGPKIAKTMIIYEVLQAWKRHEGESLMT